VAIYEHGTPGNEPSTFWQHIRAATRGLLKLFVILALVLVVGWILLRVVGLTWAVHTTKTWVTDRVGLSDAISGPMIWLFGILMVAFGLRAFWYLFVGYQVSRAIVPAVIFAAIWLAGNIYGDHNHPQLIEFKSPEDIVFFGRKGEPRVWYAQPQGKPCVELFDARGFDPYTGEALQPITPAIARLWRDCRKQHTAASVASGQSVNRKAKAQRYPRISFPQFVVEIVGVERSGSQVNVSLRLTNSHSGKTIVLSTLGNEVCNNVELRDNVGKAYACVEGGLGQMQFGGGVTLSPNGKAVVTLEFASKDAAPHAAGALRLSLPIVVSGFSYGVIHGVWNDYAQTIPAPEASYRVVLEI